MFHISAGYQNHPLACAHFSLNSLTGNPRNKVALRPGFSLMDWIKLTKSGKDLAGTGGRLIPVTPSELRKHNKRSDAWMALNGKVNLPDLNLTDFIINFDAEAP